MTFEVFLSVVDIVDENFRDLLLAEDQPKVALAGVMRDATYGVRVDGATISPVRTASHVRSLLATATEARKAGGREKDSSMVSPTSSRHSRRCYRGMSPIMCTFTYVGYVRS